MAEITSFNLNAAKVLVGPKLTRLMGGADDYFSIESTSDVGAIIGGIQGDVMMTTREQNAYMGTLTMFSASSSVGTVLKLWRVGTTFPVQIEFNDFTFNGWAVVVNLGAWAASLGTNTRTMTLGLAYQSGNLESGVGEVVGV